MTDRRGFVRAAVGGLAAAARLPAAAAYASPGHSGAGAARRTTEAPARGRAGAFPVQPVGAQLYTVRSLMAVDMAATLDAVAAIGYLEVELAGLFGTAPPVVRGLLDGAGLSAVSSHVPLARIRAEPSAVLDEAEALGLRFVTCPSIGRDELSPDGIRRVADDFDRFAEAARAQGFGFAYHNHDVEFRRVRGMVPYDLLLERCDASLVRMQLDVYWMVNGGRDPLEYFRDHPGRFPMIHAKDRTASGAMVDVGAGAIDFGAILGHADQAGLEHWLVEHDHPPDPLASLRTSYRTLAGLGA